MTGVASPMLKAFPARGVRFVTGLLVGGVAAGLLLSLAVYLIGSSAVALLPSRNRLLIVAGIAMTLGIADVIGRTPSINRQVPQRMVRSVPAGFLGLTYGFDLGLLFTTQKTTSLIWLAIAMALLLEPASSPLILLAIALGAAGIVVLVSFILNGDMARIEGPLLINGRHLSVVDHIRKGTGLLILATVPILAWQALIA
ncbi:hypothetical protein EPN29_10120 [bacterium]|nr:MAG: hypothetical protein EPN29_10120 [bacterium]